MDIYVIVNGYFYTYLFCTRKTSGSKQNETSDYIRQTFHISQEYKKAITLMSAHEDLDKSEIVRKSLGEFIPQKYIKMVVGPDE